MIGGRRQAGRGFSRWPIFSLSLAALTAGVGLAGAAGAAPALPGGGHVAAGSATIASAGGTETIQQTSARAVIDWTSFSIGKGASVSFANGSGATLNEVGGGEAVQIDGMLTATGSVYVIDPAGVIVGRSGVVNVRGTFEASTLDPGASQFLKGGPLTFAGASAASVVNLGRIGSLGGDVALIGTTVRNSGRIAAPHGDVGLAAGAEVVVQDRLLDGGKFAVVLGGPGTSVTNSGLIQAAEAELRANGGNVYALAGNNGSQIEATGVAADDGKVFLVAEGGETVARGTITAKTATGAGGEVETSGATVDFNGLRVVAGDWLVDPTNLTVNAAAATSIDTSLAAGTSVTLQTTASGASGPGVTSSGPGDIIVASPLTWSTGATLTLDAFHAIAIDAPITVSGAGGVALTDNGSLGFAGGSIRYGPTNHGGTFKRDGTSYTLIYSMAQLAALNGGAGSDALATSLDASGVSYTAAVVGSFNGTFEGLGNTISNLTIAAGSSTNNVGLFGVLHAVGTLRDIGLVGGSVSGHDGVGELVGTSAGSVVQSYATGAVSGQNYVGGLVGYQSEGSISQSYTTGVVSGAAESTDVGGLVGYQFEGSISQSYATGAVNGALARNYVGGLVGYQSQGSISQSYATGVVSGSSDVGGLVGYQLQLDASISQSYATGAVSGSGEGAGGLVGESLGSITDAYASGTVNGVTGVGGLVGVSFGAITQSYATGAPTGFDDIGGLVGFMAGGSVATSYWDAQTTGRINGVGLNSGGSFSATVLTTAQFATASNLAGFTFGTAPGGSGWVIVDADGTLNNAGGAAGATRPMLLSEYSTNIVNGHQLELANLNLAASYTLGANINLAPELADPSGVWFVSSDAPAAGYGFVPIGGVKTGFTGSFDGQSFTISGLVIGRPSTDDVGLFGDIGAAGTVVRVRLIGGSVAGSDKVGDLAGADAGEVDLNYATGAVSGADYVGGLVGDQLSGAVAKSYATGAVSGAGDVGGLVGVQGAGVIDLSHATGTVNAPRAVGGLAGRQAAGSIIQSYATGAVTGALYAGGLVGFQSGGGVTNAYATGAVSGSTDAGGLIGDQTGGSASFTYAAGAVTGTTDVGGLLGIGAGSVTMSYWDTQATGQSAGVGSEGPGGTFSATGLTTAQMQNGATYSTTYAGWNFTTIWFPPSDGGGASYPQLRP